MATVHALPTRLAASVPPATLRPTDDEDGVETLSLIARQFGEAIGADGTVLLLQSGDGEEDSVLSRDGACAGRDTPAVADMEDGQELPAKGGAQWLLHRFPISKDGGTALLLGSMFERARGGARRVAEAESRFKPLIASVARLWGRNRTARRRLAGYASALDHADMGVVLLDQDADILFANKAASTILDGGRGIRRRRQSLTASDLGDAVKLHVAVDHVVGEAAAGRTSRRTPIVPLSRGGGQRPLLVSVLAPDVAPKGPRDVAAILYLCDPELDLKPLMGAACRFYRLSPVETRLASLLAGGSTLAEASDAMRIKEQTARSYLKQVFIKTGTRRQAELTRLLLTSISRTSMAADIDLV